MAISHVNFGQQDSSSLGMWNMFLTDWMSSPSLNQPHISVKAVTQFITLTTSSS